MAAVFTLTLVLSSLLVQIDAFAVLGLTATNQNCTNEGQEVVVPLVSNYPCITCMCKDGHVQCQKETCPSTQGCYMLQHEKANRTKCCNVCKGCDYRGVHYDNGREWTDAASPCQVLSCHGGVITIANQSCQTQCNNPLPPGPGQCCPRCPDCTLNGKKLSEGQSEADPEDPCVRCQCTAGGLVCTKKACPVLACAASRTVLKPGACCPECQGSHGDFEPKGRCLVGKKFYQNGSAFRPDSCTNCTCRDTTSVCHRQVCPPVKPCPPGVVEEGDVCCPKCRPVPPLKPAPLPNNLPTQISPTLPASRPSTCSYRGVTYQDGGTWSLDSCTQCMCNKGEVRCSVQQCPVYRARNEIHAHHGAAKVSKSGGQKSKKNKMWRSTPPTFSNAQASPCPAGHHPVKEPGQCCPKCVEDDAVCTVFGDPHYRTYDGRVFNFQGACKYLLTSDCKNNSFSVRVTNDARSSQSFSWTKTVTLTIEDLKVTLGQNMKVKVNHKRVSLPFVSLGVLSIVQEGYSVVVRTNIGVKLLWDGESFLEVTVPPPFKNRLCGLCGNFNGRRQDDLRMRSGQMAKSINQFGNSWKVGGPKSCSRQEPPLAPPSSQSTNKVSGSSAAGPAAADRSPAAGREPLCQRQWEVRIRAVRECNALKALMFAPCHKKVSPVRYFKSCLLDMCECPGGKQCYCEALTAYAHECERHDVIVDPKWREMTSCTGHGPPGAFASKAAAIDASP